MVIVLCSDHGWHLGEKRYWHKSTLWEAVTRIPFIIVALGMVLGVFDHPVSLIDPYPILIELYGLGRIENYDG
ncbi:MAG: Choline-sulfatase [Verrucomicrobia subdivision 3 bacterium]|nr:Choline-sulfatase [Limisphaerales bacterium]MCS1413983.1 Choline-sulfatase [Limisphaerales bacterium]